MAESTLFEYDADDADVHVHAGVAVLALSTDKGRVAISMRPDVLERLALRIQLESARASDPARLQGHRPESSRGGL
jgi:hypothetical protein